jgi:hypothetical protein
MRTSLLALLVVTISAAGCGEGRSNDRSTESTNPANVTLSKEQLIAKADAICRRMNDEFAADEPRDQGVTETARITPHRAVLEQRVVSELDELKPPRAFAGQLQRVISTRRTLAEELAAVGRDAKAGDTAAVRKLAASKAKLHHELRAFATAAGFKVCGRVG